MSADATSETDDLAPDSLSTPTIAGTNTPNGAVPAGWRGGPVLLAAHREGKKLTQRQGILAKCADCMGEYKDGRNDCGVKACPLYRWMPYR